MQRFSVHDGPGIRTNVFLKGCPLRCAWCCNPESHGFQPELGLSLHQCIHCGQFDDNCSDAWSHGAVTQSEKDKFGPSTETCPGGAIRWLGTRRSAGDIVSEVLRDRPFYRGEGGMTLNGWRANSSTHFCRSTIRLAKQSGPFHSHRDLRPYSLEGI